VSTPAACSTQRHVSAARVVYVATDACILVSAVMGRPKERDTIRLC
jgi:hypothetical protein